MAKKRKQSEKQQRMANARCAERKAAAKAERKKQKHKKAVIWIVVCVLIVAIVTGAITWGVKTKPLTHLFSVEKTEHYSLSASELSFYAWQIYQQYLFSASDSSTVPDTDVSLAEQYYDSDTTWEKYFADAAVDYAKRILTLCEAAYTEGFEPETDITAEAQESVSSFDSTTFPKGVEEDDVIHAMELYFTAVEFSAEMENQITLSDADLEGYYEENAQDMQVCSYICFGFAYDDSTDSYSITSETAEEDARDLRHCTTKEAFESWVTDYYKENYSSLEDEDIAEYVDSLYMENTAYIEGDSISEWAFSGDVSVGESTIITEADDDETGTILVCLLLSEPERDESYPVNLRQILFTTDTYGSTEDAQAQAESVLEAWQSGDQTEDSFANYANYYSEDTSTDGGLYENVSGSEMLSDWKNWFFDDSRQTGDVTILESSYGVCIVYYVSLEETPMWEITASEALAEEYYNDQYEVYQEQADIEVSSFFQKLIKVSNA